MKADWRKLGPADYVTSVWSGGRTTQLAIAPAGARYAERDFLWRVSSATVELEESDFTPLPDYDRLIATLQGEIELTHNGCAPLRLRPFEVHAFSGADGTRSRGRCTDFNLMLRKGKAEGSMETLALSPGSRTLSGSGGSGEQLLFCAEGECLATNGSEAAPLEAGESLLCAAEETLSLRTAEGAVLMLCRMYGRESE